MKMFVEERRKSILEYIKKNSRATVKELAEYLTVSEATLRTDLKEMEIEGLLDRTHGGAKLPEQSKVETGSSFFNRKHVNQEEKAAIGNKAAEFLTSGQCILLDASSTSLEFAKVLKSMPLRLTILTNGIYTAIELKENPLFTVILVGGILRIGSVGLEGTLGNDMLKKVNIDTMFTSASGFTLEDGLTDFNVYEVELKKTMVEASNKLIALLDHSKLGKSSIASYVSIDNIDLIITDEGISDEEFNNIKKSNIEIIKASKQYDH